MSEGERGDLRGALVALGLALLLTLGWHAATGAVGFGFTDEGFLWVGVQETAAGAVPVRDFQSYDPGRYYWCLLWSPLVGTGLLGVRLAGALFLALGLACGLRVVSRLSPRPELLLAAGALLLFWAFPRHKVYEPALAMAAVFVGLRLLERPDLWRHAQAGAFVGLAAWFGRNHALYAGVGLFTLMLWSHWKRGAGQPPPALARSLGATALGGVAGAIPVVAMFAFVPGYAEAYIDSVLFFVRHGTNTPLPFPWPWKLLASDASGAALLLGLGTGFAYLLAPAVLAWGAFAAWRADPHRPAVLVAVAAVAIGLPYAHHASVRSDLPHLAQAIHPVLLALAALPLVSWRPGWCRWLVWAVAALVTVAVAPARLPLLPGIGQRVEAEIGGETLQLSSGLAKLLARIQRGVSEQVPADQPLFIAPVMPGFYPLLGRRPPVPQTYILWRATEAEQRELIGQLSEVDWALLGTIAEPAFRLAFTNPEVARYLAEEFVPTRSRLPRGYTLLRRRGAGARGVPDVPYGRTP